jgi:hypothetical protein
MTRRIVFSILIVAALAALTPRPGWAIPAFARKYKFSCTTCHAPFPRLKDYGNDFAANGFALPEGEEPRRAYRDTGDPLLLLQSELPVAVRFDAWATYGNEPEESWDLKTPWLMKLLSGGQVAPNVGYYFYFYMAERGEVAGVEDAYLHFNDLGGVSFDVMVGQFQLSDPMMKRELRLTLEDYQIYRIRVGESLTDLTYDRGLMLTYDFDFGLGLVGQVVNGNGKEPADEQSRDYDSDRDKGYAGRGVYSAGPLTLGYYYFRSREVLRNGGDEFSNEVEIHGPDLAVSAGEKAHLTAQYLHRHDSDPGLGTDCLTSEGVVAEMVLLPRGEDGREALTLLYNRVDSDQDALDYHTLTVGGSWLLARNLRLSAEYTRDFELEGDRIGLGLAAGF